MKYSSYTKPNYVLNSDYQVLDLIPIYRGCMAALDKTGCGCLGTCVEIIDYLTKEEVDIHNIRKLIPYQTLRIK